MTTTTDLKEVHYRNMKGKLLWKESLTHSQEWKFADKVKHEGKHYKIERFALADDILHLNLISLFIQAK